MIFFKIGIFLLFIHGTVCCEKYLGCEECLGKSCKFVVTSERKAVCLGKDENVSVLKEIKKIRFCKFVELYTKESDNAPSSPNEVQLTKAIHAAKIKNVTRGAVERFTPTEAIETTVPSVTTDLTDSNDAKLNMEIHVAKMKDATRKTTQSPVAIPKFEDTATEETTTVSENAMKQESAAEETTTASENAMIEESATEESTTVSENAMREGDVVEETTKVSENQMIEQTMIVTAMTEQTTTIITTAATTELENPPESTTTELPVVIDSLQTPTTEEPLVTTVTSELPTSHETFQTATPTVDATTEAKKGKPVTQQATIQVSDTLPFCKSDDNKTMTLDNVDGHLQDSDVILSDVEEIFMSFKLIFKCEKGNRNDSLMFAYVSSLCSIARLSEQIGIEKFNDRDQAFFMANRARNFDATCSAVRYIKKKCRVPSPPKIRVQKRGILYGPRSPLYNRVHASYTCPKNGSKEDVLSRLARITCYSAELFLELYRLMELNSYDVSYGHGNPSHRYPSTCFGLGFVRILWTYNYGIPHGLARSRHVVFLNKIEIIL